MQHFNKTQGIRLKVRTDNFENGEHIKVSLEPLDMHQHPLGKKYTHATVDNGYAQHIFTIQELADELHIDAAKIFYVAGWIDKDNDGVVDGHEVVYLQVLQWHDPVDNPQLARYNISGIDRPYSNMFGMVRIAPVTFLPKKHQGVDLFAKPGTPVYACVDGTVVRSEVVPEYGKVVTIKAKNPDYVRSRKRPYTLKYPEHHEMEHGPGFNENGDFYFFYAHLIESYVQLGQEVKAGDVIGKTGTSGFGTTKDPHLHFEILNIRQATGLNNRVNPAFYVDFKFPVNSTISNDEQTQTKNGLPNHSVWGDPSIER